MKIKTPERDGGLIYMGGHLDRVNFLGAYKVCGGNDQRTSKTGEMVIKGDLKAG